MPYSAKPLFSGSAFTKTWATSESDTLNLEVLQSDYPPGSADYASFFIAATLDAGGSATTLTITAQFRIGDSGNALAYGTSHNVLNDSNVNTLTLSAGSEVTFEANLYAQSWWKANTGVRITIVRSATNQVVMNATGVIR